MAIAMHFLKGTKKFPPNKRVLHFSGTTAARQHTNMFWRKIHMQITRQNPFCSVQYCYSTDSNKISRRRRRQNDVRIINNWRTILDTNSGKCRIFYPPLRNQETKLFSRNRVCSWGHLFSYQLEGEVINLKTVLFDDFFSIIPKLHITHFQGDFS